VEGPAGQLVILDAGTGIRGLGLTLVERQNGAVKAEILLSHTHWDHIQGLPYFKPFFAPGNTVRIWGSKQGTTSLDEILHLQMDPAVFPVPLTAVSATLSVEEVRPGVEFTVGPFQARAMQLRHPGTTLAYRLKPKAGGQSMAYVTDNELGPGGNYGTPGSWRRDLVQFLKGVDLLIHDAMYTPAELDTHRGWDIRRTRKRWSSRWKQEPGSWSCSITSPSMTTARWTRCMRRPAARPSNGARRPTSSWHRKACDCLSRSRCRTYADAFSHHPARPGPVGRRVCAGRAGQ